MKPGSVWFLFRYFCSMWRRGGACDDKEIMSVRVNILENEVRRLWDKFVPMAGA